MAPLDDVVRFEVAERAFLMRLRRADRRLYVGRYGFGEWHESKVASEFAALCRRTRCMLDIGAHIGWYSCLAGTLAPDARICAFEMDRGNARMAKRNLALNEVAGASVLEIAVSDRHRSRALFQQGRSTLENRLGAPSSRGSRLVSTVSIDGWCDEGGVAPDFVKIDVEGAETRVLQGMRNTILQYKPNIFVEVHDEVSRVICTDLLQRQAYAIQAFRLADLAPREWCNQVLIARSVR